MNFQWYPGHMTKAIRMMQENIKLIDIIIELTDARIPASGRNPDIDELGKNKYRLILLNKADLADPSITSKWKEFYKNEGYFVLEMNSKTGNEAGKVKDLILKACADKIEKDRKRGIVGRPIRAMVAGIPNVGKSTFINKLAGKASAKTGNKPGVTKGKQWISLGKNMQLLDTPGILWPKFEDDTVGLHLALIGSMNDENLDTTELACELIKLLEENYAEAIPSKYNITKEQVDELEEVPYSTHLSAVLSAIAINRKCFKQGAEPDISRAAAMLLDDFRNGRLGKITLERPNE
ncbi:MULTISPECIES: ribosome biogenesis GTPase YlqF [unclassified Butyrivibrio]|uniref:ribosome biogenesis GTPase YlqF n=1 Tax=unclassified Butyrivibrio TaxID=2639466 RepID=UPI0008F1EA3B|nr:MULTISPECIES: ribosome biogenesis GTPase YlqF [unclassified Butyrivibrio]RKM62670.1 ribosome biogenesis GTPase YlqF [Butyrivibrio sp. XB500-5]SFU45971.1 ribosome biogenesis GTPase A [Butyrivibrio sp. INlla21]